MSVLFVVVVGSRVPFLYPGHGSDPDGWMVANTARCLAEDGVYEPSRLPGYPVQEYICGLLWRPGGWRWLNPLTAIFSAIAAVATAAIARKLHCSSWLACGLAFAVTPVVYAYSCGLMDYMWAVAFLMIAVYLALSRRIFFAGLLVGIATGCRITSMLMIVPITVIAFQQTDEGRDYGLQIVRAIVPAMAVGAICYIPPFAKFGIDFLTFYELDYPPLANVATAATFGVWGTAGAIFVFIAAVSVFIGAVTSGPSEVQDGDSIDPTLAFVVGICLFTVSFLRLPHQAGYLIPVVPLVLLIIAMRARVCIVWALCIVLMFSAMVDINRAPTENNRWNITISHGPVIVHHAASTDVTRLADDVLNRVADIKAPAIIVTGWFYPVIEARAFVAKAENEMTSKIYCIPASPEYRVTGAMDRREPMGSKKMIILNERSGQFIQFIEWADRAVIDHAEDLNMPVYYIRGINEPNRKVFNTDLNRNGRPLRIR